jgi:hypothetical protein
MKNQSNLDNLEIQSQMESHINNFKNEMNSKSRDGLEMALKRINYLCDNVDPYNSLDLAIEEENIINLYELKGFLSNPFDFTNIILQMIDVVEAQLKSKLQ